MNQGKYIPKEQQTIKSISHLRKLSQIFSELVITIPQNVQSMLPLLLCDPNQNEDF